MKSDAVPPHKCNEITGRILAESRPAKARILGNEPVKHWNTVLNGKLASGKRLEETAIENLAGGGINSSKEYEHYDWAILKKPSVTNPKRTHVIEIWERGLRVSSGKVDLHITTGFNDRTEEFVFEGVPLE